MTSYRTTSRADDDLLDIYLYGIERFGRAQAIRYATGLHHVFGLLGENSRMGRKAEEIAEGVRRHEHGSHIILYQEDDEAVLILAIVHKASVRRLKL